MDTLQAKLELCSKGLRKWSRNMNRDRQQAIKDKKETLNTLQRNEKASNMQARNSCTESLSSY